MKILHTSDWHLGRTLEGRDRLPEQAAALSCLTDYVQNCGVDLVLIAGDVYDTFTPPAAAEALFYETVERMAALGASVVVIAGNHDSPARLTAAGPLAGVRGIYLLGAPGDAAEGADIVASGAGWLRLRPGKADCDAVVLTLPYPSEGRMLSATASARAEPGERPFERAVTELLAQSAAQTDECAVNLLVAHIFARGGAVGGAERPIEGVGGANLIDAKMLPGVQYAALGHLHRRQRILDHVHYSGSLMMNDFSECGQQKCALLLDLLPGGAPVLEELPIEGPRALARWQVKSVEEALQKCAAHENHEDWLSLSVVSDQPLSQSQVAQLRAAHPRLVTIQWLPPENREAGAAQNWRARPLPELFAEFCRKTRGAPPSEALVSCFVRLAEGVEEDASDTPAI